jgi:hypothetical protein
MEESADVRLLNNICDSLRSDDVETIISTGQFLETVVVHDFPANVFLLSRELIIVSSFLGISHSKLG